MRWTFFRQILLLASLHAQAAWPDTDIQEVRAFAWRLDRAGETVVGREMRPEKGAINPKGTPLNREQIARLLKAEARRYAPRPAAGCYAPHNAFIFYDAQSKPVAFLEICFDCLGSRSAPNDETSDPDFIALAELCAELKLPYGRFKTLAEFRATAAPILGR